MTSREDKPKMIEAAVDCLPDNMQTDELSALLLTILDAYMGDDKTVALSLLLTTAMVYARSIGMPDKRMAKVLRSAAEHLEKPETEKKVH
jgi:hypothetical protein